MKTRLVFYVLFLCIAYLGCDGLDLKQSSSSLSRLSVVPESEVTSVSYDNIDGHTYVHVELPDTLENAHTILVCAYDMAYDNTCCSQWTFEDVQEFWIPYGAVENCAVRVTCWGRFGVRYITGIW